MLLVLLGCGVGGGPVRGLGGRAGCRFERPARRRFAKEV